VTAGSRRSPPADGSGGGVHGGCRCWCTNGSWLGSPRRVIDVLRQFGHWIVPGGVHADRRGHRHWVACARSPAGRVTRTSRLVVTGWGERSRRRRHGQPGARCFVWKPSASATTGAGARMASCRRAEIRVSMIAQLVTSCPPPSPGSARPSQAPIAAGGSL